MAENGVIHGRFQILHNDHMKYLLAGKARCKHLVVGITNPDPTLTRDDPANPQRSDPAANPLTYFERYVTIREAMLEAGVDYKDFSIVPLPINIPELWHYYVPLDAVFFLTIYDEWGKRKHQLLQSLGLKTDVMWERVPEEKGLTAAEIRQHMIEGEPWEHLVPLSTAVLMKRWRIPERLRATAVKGASE